MTEQYVAKKRLKDFVNGRSVVYEPGDVIEEFPNWNIHAQRSHLNLDLVEKVGGSVAVPTTLPKQLKPKASETMMTHSDTSLDCCEKTFKSERALKAHIKAKHGT